MKTHSIRSLAAALMLVCLLAANLTVCASATTSGSEIQPRYTGISTLYASLKINASGAATCTGSANVLSGNNADLVVELQRDGSTIKTWSTSGNGFLSIDKVYYVTTGHDYQVVVTATVAGSGGSPYQKISDIRSY